MRYNFHTLNCKQKSSSPNQEQKWQGRNSCVTHYLPPEVKLFNPIQEFSWTNHFKLHEINYATSCINPLLELSKTIIKSSLNGSFLAQSLKIVLHYPMMALCLFLWIISESSQIHSNFSSHIYAHNIYTLGLVQIDHTVKFVVFKCFQRHLDCMITRNTTSKICSWSQQESLCHFHKICKTWLFLYAQFFWKVLHTSCPPFYWLVWSNCIYFPYLIFGFWISSNFVFEFSFLQPVQLS